MTKSKGRKAGRWQTARRNPETGARPLGHAPFDSLPSTMLGAALSLSKGGRLRGEAGRADASDGGVRRGEGAGGDGGGEGEASSEPSAAPRGPASADAAIFCKSFAGGCR